MGSANPFKDQPHYFTKKFLPWTLYALLPIAFIRLYFYPTPLSLSSTNRLPPNNPIIITPYTSSSSSPPPLPPPQSSQEVERTTVQITCDYSNGKWVHDKVGPLYNGTNCGTIKDGQNCVTHGRPDLDYLYWRWRPKQCQLPRFEATTFLQHLRNKHLAFVGDSMARNQLESLLCMLATASIPQLVYTEGEDKKFRRWHISSHNVTISVYWSPFLVNGIEKSEKAKYNKLYLDSLNERWASDVNDIDMIVLSVGHWFLHSAVYFYGDTVLGCHYCEGQNYTEIGFFNVFARALNTTLNTIMKRREINEQGTGGINPMNVILTTFSPAHFEGDWDKFGACNKTKPYKEQEKKLQWMDEEMRKVGVAAVEAAKEKTKKFRNFFRFEALDVTKLSLLRPDGHPGPYMHPFPFANGVSERVQNDCVHWCLPGPVDTWNEILLDVMKRWEGQSRSGK